MDTEKNEEKKIEENTNEEIHLTFYTLTAMLGTLVAAATTVLCGIMLAKPDFYVTKSQFGGLYYDDMIEVFREFIFNSENSSKLNTYCIIVAVLSAVATILTLVVVAKAANPAKKPALVLSMGAFIAAVAALVMEIITRNYALGLVDDYLDAMEMSSDKMFFIFDAACIAVIVNVVFLLLMVFGVASGRKKWNKNGSSF